MRKNNRIGAERFRGLCLVCAAASLFAARADAGVRISYTAEGDSTNATDTLTSDGAQNGTFFGGNIEVTNLPSSVKHGSSAYDFSTVNGDDHIALPGSTSLGAAFTLGAWVKVLGPSPGDMRFFTSYDGNAVAVGDLILDVLSSGVRFYVNGKVTTSSWLVPARFAGEYHHIGATFSNGTAKIYFDGAPLATNTAVTATAVTLDQNLIFGRYSHNADGQFAGYADDLLVLDRAMSEAEMAVLGKFTPLNREVLYTAEGDTTSATDALTNEGSQDGLFEGGATTNGSARFGNRAFYFPGTSGNAIQIPSSSDLGSTFTLAAFIDPAPAVETENHRWFSAYSGTGGVAPNILMGFYKSGSYGFALYIHNTIVNSNVSVAGGYHHVAGTYSNGVAKLYLDGVLLKTQTITDRPVSMDRNLRFGCDDNGAIPFSGSADDIVVLTRALSGTEIAELALNGGFALLTPPAGTIFILR